MYEYFFFNDTATTEIYTLSLHDALPIYLVMHGSSSVPQELQDIINQYGGQMKPTWGVPVEEIQRGIKNGVRKINIDTDNRIDRKSTRLNSSHANISYAVFCLKKKKNNCQ